MKPGIKYDMIQKKRERKFDNTWGDNMSDMFDYLEWRGDLTFRQAPVNMVDNLLFSCLAYVVLYDIVGHRALSNAFCATGGKQRQPVL